MFLKTKREKYYFLTLATGILTLVFLLLNTSTVPSPPTPQDNLDKEHLQQLSNHLNFFGHTQPKTNIPPAQLSPIEKSKLQFGDIILRRGYGRISNFIVDFLADQYPLSHCGIWCDDSIGIVHAISNTKHDGILSEPLQDYLSESVRHSLVILRPKNNLLKNDLYKKYLHYIRNQKKPFDMQFNDNDTTKIFCLELVRDAIHYAGATHCLQCRKKALNLDVLQLSSFFDSTCFTVIINQFDSIPLGEASLFL